MLNNEICYLYGICMQHFAAKVSHYTRVCSSILSLNLWLLLPDRCSILQLKLVMLQENKYVRGFVLWCWVLALLLLFVHFVSFSFSLLLCSTNILSTESICTVFAAWSPIIIPPGRTFAQSFFAAYKPRGRFWLKLSSMVDLELALVFI